MRLSNDEEQLKFYYIYARARESEQKLNPVLESKKPSAGTYTTYLLYTVQSSDSTNSKYRVKDISI